jgi:hypothetical protein
MDVLAFNLPSHLELQRTGYLEPPLTFQQRSQLQAASAPQWQNQSAVFHQHLANQASMLQLQQNIAAAIVSHQQPNHIQASVFQQQQYESAAFMQHQPRNPQQAATFAFHQRQWIPIQTQQNQVPVIQIAVDVEDEGQEFLFRLDHEEQKVVALNTCKSWIY